MTPRQWVYSVLGSYLSPLTSSQARAAYHTNARMTPNPSFPPIARGNPSVIKTDAKRERIIYANSRTVVIKNVADPTKVQLFTGHQYPVTAVAMSPSGCYMATGDKSGKLMIWVRTLRRRPALQGGQGGGHPRYSSPEQPLHAVPLSRPPTGVRHSRANHQGRLPDARRLDPRH